MQVPHFASAPGGFVERITPFVQIITFEPGEQIVNEGSQNYKLFWLVKGTCHCIKILPLVKRLMNANYAGKTYKVIPNNPGMVLEKNDEAIREQVNIQEMEIGSHFPDLPLPRGAKPMEEVLYVNKREYMEQIKKEDPTEDSTKAFVSIIAKTKVEVACVNQTDYVEFANNDMILSIINSKNIFRVPIAQLQDSYLEKRQWVSYKKKLVNEVTSKDAKAR